MDPNVVYGYGWDDAKWREVERQDDKVRRRRLRLLLKRARQKQRQAAKSA